MNGMQTRLKMMPGNKSTKILPNQMATKNFGKLKMQAQYRPNLAA